MLQIQLWLLLPLLWLKKSPASLIELKDSLAVALSPTTGISMPQLIALLFFTILVNLAITHYQTITRPCLGFVGNWMSAAVEPFKVCMNVKFYQLADMSIQESITSVNLNAVADSAPTFRSITITQVDQ